MKKGRVVVVGSSNIDLTVKTDRLPEVGETVIGGVFYKSFGGKGANQALTAKKSGAEVEFITMLGNDGFGNEYYEYFKKSGIGMNGVSRTDKLPTGIALIMVDKNGKNKISVSSGANTLLSKLDIERSIKLIKESDVLLVQLEIPIETVFYAIYVARKNKVTTILNPAPSMRLSRNLLKMVDIITPNRIEAHIITGIDTNKIKGVIDAAKYLLDMGCRNAIITMGGEGVLYAGKKGIEKFKALKVKTIDTTGAGDVFNGAFASALSNKFGIKSAIRFSLCAAALSTTKRGAQGSIPDLKEINRVWKRHF